MAQVLRARLILPVSGPAIENGALILQAGRIESVDSWPAIQPSLRESDLVEDLGEVLLLPGLVNAHCHLDYTGMAGQIPPPKRFVDWIKAIVALKGQWKDDQFAASWGQGAQQLLQTGTTTVVDIESVPDLVPGIWETARPRLISCRELIHFKRDPSPESVVTSLASDWENRAAPGVTLALSPHAPYSTCSEILREAARTARQRGWLLTTHVAESEEEMQMFRFGQGPLYEWLYPQRGKEGCGGGSPVQYLERLGYLDANLLAVHVNYLDHGDAATLARHKVSVVHCPRSHAYFDHARFPIDELARAGVNLCLGTDSLASVAVSRNRESRLSLFDEMNTLSRQAPGMAPLEIVRMATCNGARALRRQGQCGALVAGADADLIAIPFTGSATGACEAVVHHHGDVDRVWIGGTRIPRPIADGVS